MEQALAKPTSITVDRQAALLVIDWQGGHHSEYPLAGIRAVCPCVTCRGGHAAMAATIPRADLYKTPTGSAEITRADLVGAYAIQFTWGDGHEAGIYTWDLLRSLCPCAQCQAQFGQ